MKKIIFLICCLFLVPALLGCSGSGSILDVDEYSVYQDGKLFLEIPTEECIMFNLNTEVEMGYQSQFPGEVFTTKRGITIGDSFEDFLNAYRDKNWMVIARKDMKETPVSYTREEFIALSKNSLPKIFEIYIRTYVVDGKLYDAHKVKSQEMAQELGIDVMEWFEIERYNSEDYDFEDYYMHIWFMDDEIKNLMLSAMTSEIRNN